MFESKIRRKEVVPHVMWTWSWEGKPPISKFKNWMREEFILNIYKNDEWAPLWAAEDKAQRVHAMMVYSYKLQWHLNVACRGVKIGDFWLKQGKTKEEWTVSVVRVSHNTICCAKISHKALFTRPNAKLWLLQMVKIVGFWGWEMLAEVGKGFFMVARLGNWSFSRREFRIWKLF